MRRTVCLYCRRYELIQIVRTPLNAIVNYLEMALENKVDDKTRHILDRAQEASASLGYVMDDLLKLTKPDDSPTRGSVESFNLGHTSKHYDPRSLAALDTTSYPLLNFL